jgi:hypothetical protein
MIKHSKLPVSRHEKLHYNWIASLKAELSNSFKLPFTINGMSGHQLYVITPIEENVFSMEQESCFFESVRSLFIENDVTLYIVAEAKLNLISHEYGILCYSSTPQKEIATFTPYSLNSKTKNLKFGKTTNIITEELPFKNLLNKAIPVFFSKNEAEDLLKINHIFSTTNLVNSN